MLVFTNLLVLQRFSPYDPVNPELHWQCTELEQLPGKHGEW